MQNFPKQFHCINIYMWPYANDFSHETLISLQNTCALLLHILNSTFHTFSNSEDEFNFKTSGVHRWRETGCCQVLRSTQQQGGKSPHRRINEANIRLCCKQEKCLQQMPHTKNANTGCQSAFSELEAKLLEWITDRRQQGVGVSVIKVHLNAKQLAGEMMQSSTFKASYGAAQKFMEQKTCLFVGAPSM